jgi:hypothetical protein
LTRAREIATQGGLVLLNSTTFSGVTTLSIDNVFSATYTNYRLVFQGTHSSTGTSLRLRLRVGGADNTSSNYVFGNGASNSAASFANINSSTGTTSFYVGELNSVIQSGTCEIFNPFAAFRTAYFENFVGINSVDAAAATMGGGCMTVATSYTGFTLFPAANNMTGNVQVYGYKNS